MAGDASLHQWLYYCQFIITWYSISGFSQNLLPATCSLHQFYTLLVLRSCVQGDRERLHFNFLWAPSPCTFFPKQDSWLVRNNVELFLECWALVIYFIPGGDPRVLGICRGKTALCKSVIPTISTVRGSELWSFSGYLNLPITTWECWGKPPVLVAVNGLKKQFLCLLTPALLGADHGLVSRTVHQLETKESCFACSWLWSREASILRRPEGKVGEGDRSV